MKRLVLMLVGACLLAAGAPLAIAQAIEFNEIAQAMQAGQRQRKTVAVFFGAPWCSWCKKMKTDTFVDPTVQALARQVVWAEVNVDDDAVVAAMFGVEGVPVLAFFNANGELLSAHGGYVGPAELAKLLAERGKQAEAPGERRKRVEALVHNAERLRAMTDAGERATAVAALLELAAEPHRELRPVVKEALSEPLAWPRLVEGLEDERLGVRAAAYDLLAEITGQRHAYDPFAAADVRREQARAWREWVDHATPPTTREAGQ